MNMTIVFSLHKFSMQPIIDLHEPAMYSGHYTTYINCCKKFCCNDSIISEFDMIDTKPPSTAYLVIYKSST